MVRTPAQPNPTQPDLEAEDEFEFPTPPQNLPYDDDEPLESPQHRMAMNLLIRACTHHLSQQNSNFFCGGNMFLYYDRTQLQTKRRGPDFFVVLDVEPETQRDRLSWKIWEEGGRYPDIIVELLSESTREEDIGNKKNLYEKTFRLPDYFVFDPLNPNSLQGWRLDLTRGYRDLVPNDRGWLWSESLQLWLGTWEGEIDGKPGTWLRFYDRQENLVLLPEEDERERAEREQERAERERERAEREQERAERERERAERTEAELELERQRTQAAQTQADAAQAELDRLRALVRQQGLENEEK
ncbi:MAG: Uma2 family endonuclease [Cyanobacteriota bacterium]|nr:Uma2 family endonuclease [Cyanobacteriota bacterium]